MKPQALYLSCCAALGALAPGAAVQAGAASTEVIESCPMPEKPSIPNGLRATEEEMLAAQQNIQGYISKGNAVLACLDELKAGWGEDASPEQLQINDLFHDRMVDDMQTIGELFNSAVRAYKGKRE